MMYKGRHRYTRFSAATWRIVDHELHFGLSLLLCISIPFM
jgi:hypothetical protein